MVKFVAIDGEADAQGRYIVMCDSEGRVLYNPDGISTVEAFEFLLALPQKCEIVCFGLNYDANQWVCDLPRANLERVAQTGRSTYLAGYKLEWIPSKMFTVSRPGKRVTVSEVWGFFQCSFVKALQNWGMEPPAEIERMKKKRGTFTQREIERIIAYCRDECSLLVTLMESLQGACETAGCVPRGRWIGAGSIASSLLIQHGAKNYHAYDDDVFTREQTDTYVLGAYFGGRTELYQQGWAYNVCSSDIRSAYPFAALNLPDMTQAHAYRTGPYRATIPFVLWHVRWGGSNSRIGPFPVRMEHGEICYPLAGEGVYHGVEVNAAMECGYPIEVLDGIALDFKEDTKPFAWIADVYKHREKFKREGNYAEKALKLGMNSIYGKHAQGYGYGRRPPFQNYFLAGYMTACTRARMLTRLCSAGLPIATATDGQITSGDMPADDSTANVGIGTWEVSSYDKVATIQPGVYLAEIGNERFVKSRGFAARDVNYDDLLSEFTYDPTSCYHYVSRRFIGLKVALHRKDFSTWRTWVEEKRSISFEIRHKRSEHVNGLTLLYPPSGPYTSIPYEPKMSLHDNPTDADLESMVVDDQPHREVS